MIIVLAPLDGHLTGQLAVTRAVMEILKEKDVSGITIGGEGLSILRTLWLVFLSVIKLLKSKNVRVVYFTPSRSVRGLARDLIPFIIARLIAQKCIVHWHGGELRMLHKSLFLKRVLKWLYHGSLHVVLSKSMQADLYRVFGKCQAKIIPNFVAIDDPVSESYSSNVTGSCSSNVKRIGFLSNLIPGKGLEDFCKLAARFQGRYSFYVGGDFLDEDYCKNFQNEVHCSFMGHVAAQHKVHFLSSLDLLVFPSRYKSEAVPLVVLEAKACGCDVVSYKVGYLEDFADDLDLHLVDSYEELVRFLLNYENFSSDRNFNMSLVAPFSRSAFRSHVLPLFDV